MKLNVTYSKHKDIDNYINSIWRFKWNKHGREHILEKLSFTLPQTFTNQLLEAKTEESARALIDNFLEESVDVQCYSEISSLLDLNWKHKSKELLSLLENTYDEKIPFPKLAIYLTSLNICPYSYQQGWIMVSANKTVEKQLNTILHELNHFMFYYYYSNIKNVIGVVNYECLKEALTVLTNKNEVGYPAQHELREWLKLQKGSVREILRRNEWKIFFELQSK